MPFDNNWFDELRQLTEQKIGIMGDPRDLAPKLDELLIAGCISQKLIDPIVALLKALYKTSYPFKDIFRVQNQHLYNFHRGRAFKKQWNIGFYAPDNSLEDRIRIGLGFKLNANFQGGVRGIDEYLDYKKLVGQKQQVFDQLFPHVIDYVEIGGTHKYLLSSDSLSAIFVSYNPSFDNDWIFIGKCLKRNENMIESPDMLATKIISIFNSIKKSGFA